MPSNTIKTYTGESFRASYIRPEPQPNTLLKPDFGLFFIIRLEEMTRLMKVPVPPTRVGNHTLLFLTDGEAEMNNGSQTYRLLPNECLVVPAGQVFSFDRVEYNRGYLCSIHPDFIAGKFSTPERLREFEFLQVWGNPHLRLEPPVADFAVSLLHRMLLDYTENGLTRPDLIQAYCLAFLTELGRVYEPASAGQQTSAQTITNRFKELLFANVTEHHLVADYAALLHVSPNHLNKSVKKSTGQSPTRWIDEAIVLEAKVLLHQTRLSVGEVAAEVGIADASYFSRLFKKYAGMTPLRFRQMIETS